MANNFKRGYTVIGSSFFKRLTNATHVQYMEEFLNMLPHGVYENKKTDLERLIEKEWSNLGYCRKNHSREQYNNKLKQLKSIMSALHVVLASEARMGHEGGDVELHSYETKVLDNVDSKGYIQGVKAFIKSWAGIASPGGEALLDESREIVDELSSMLQFQGMEDRMIANVGAQIELRENTDNYVFNIVAKASVEAYELRPEVESEKERLELIDEFLAAWFNLVNRVRISVKNKGKEEDEPEDEPLTTAKMRIEPNSETQEPDTPERRVEHAIKKAALENYDRFNNAQSQKNETSASDERVTDAERLNSKNLSAHEIADLVMKNVIKKYGTELTDEEIERYTQAEYVKLTLPDVD